MTRKCTENDWAYVSYAEQTIVDVGSEAEPFNQLERLGVLLVITAILIYVLMAFVGPTQFGSVGQGDFAAAKAQIKQFDTALTAYKIKFGDLPDSLDWLVKSPSGKPIMNAKTVPLDPWGTPFLYLTLGTPAYVIVSLGADSEPGGEGRDADIRSDEI